MDYDLIGCLADFFVKVLLVFWFCWTFSFRGLDFGWCNIKTTAWAVEFRRLDMVTLPIMQIGEENWIDRLTAFLIEHDVEIVPLSDCSQVFQHVENTLNWTIPQQVKEYFSCFGGIESSDFIYGLYEMS